MNTTLKPRTEVGHIMVVDDEDDCNFVTKLVLQQAGYTGRLTCYTSAAEALAHFRKGEDLPDLMFVDLNMPAVNGFELLAACEAERLLPNDLTSVVMFSSSNRPSDLERALSFRSVMGYVEKALSVDSFERVLADRRAKTK
ncbi:MAG: response regulator [Flavobacteriales bacterium]